MQNVAELEQSKKINWDTLIAVTVFHALTIVAVIYFSWVNLAAAALMYWVAGSLGIGLGYHRLLTHRGFKTPKWLEYILATCGTLALQSGPIKWVTTHRIHHAFVDQPEKDPHTPRDGAFWSHIGWIMQGTSQEHDAATLKRYAPDLIKDKYLQWISRYYYLPLIAVGAIFFAIGGVGMALWGAIVSVTIGWHFTWLVNSATHIWGSRRFETNDDSKNNGLVALVSWGEGWHNNHHANPVSAKHGMAWYEIDINWLQISLLEKLGLAEKVKVFDMKAHREEIALKKAA